MLTPEEIRNIAFTKGIGGYKTNEVDLFIDQCADTVETLLSEKAELNKKLEILADKLVEYRNDEDSIRTALLSAQRLGDTVVREANHKAGLIMDDANIKAQKIAENARRSIVKEEEELRRIEKEVASFKARMLSIYREHLSLINVLPEPEEEEQAPEESAPAEPEAASPAEPTASAAEQEPVKEEPSAPAAAEASSAKEEPVFEPVAAATPKEEPASLSAQDAAEVSAFYRNIPRLDEEEPQPAAAAAVKEEEPVRRERPASSRYSDLKFGEDYDIAQDAAESRGLFRRKK